MALVICALVPFLTLTAAVLPQLSKSLGLSKPALEVTIALSDAGYAFGTLMELVLTAAAALLTGLATGGGALVAVGSALIGFGVGASVPPALFIAGFSLRSSQIQRIFALVELLRGVTAFLVAPVLLCLATVIGTSLADGTRAAIWICLGIAAVGGITAVALFALGGERLQTPTWRNGTRERQPGPRRNCSPGSGHSQRSPRQPGPTPCNPKLTGKRGQRAAVARVRENALLPSPAAQTGGRRQVTRKALTVLITAAGAWLLVSQWTDIVRYLKIRQMSQGNGHPENVPARGAVRYQQPDG